MQWLSPRELVGLPNNPRTITQVELNRLCDSIRNNGFWKHRPLGGERQGDQLVVLDGNQRLKAARRLKMKSGPVVIYEGLTDQERDDLILRSNISNGEWDTGLLATDFAQVDLEDIGLKIDLPDLTPQEPTPATSQGHTSEPPETAVQTTDPEEEQELSEFYQKMLGDYVYPSDNEFGIPVLARLPINPTVAESFDAGLMETVDTAHLAEAVAAIENA